MEDLLNDLNPIQQTIVKDTEGYCLTLAGAGSGKTRVLVYRIAYLLGPCQVRPWRILAVTFTNKASKEMRGRLLDLAGDAANDVWIGTFHGICVRILARFGEEIGLAGGRFTIIDDKEQQKIIKDANALLGTEYDLKVVSAAISNAKNALMSPLDCLEVATTTHEKDIANIYTIYEEKKQENSYLDYDDLIMKTVQLLQKSATARDHYQSQFKYVLTDETQDTNKAQFELLRLLVAQHENLFAVGDTDQSIYGWRGAEIENILHFEKFFPNTKVHRLEQNYRSTRTIVEASNALIVNNEQRLEKTAFTENKDGDAIILYEADDDSREGDFIASIIERIHTVEGSRYKDFAILYRTNRQSRAIEVSLTQAGIPYKVLGGTSFYDRKEIKDLVAYLRTISNQFDSLAFDRIINVPRRGIGATTVNRIQAYADECSISFSKALEHIDDVPKISEKTKQKIRDFNTLIEKFRAYDEQEDSRVSDLIQMVLTETGYRALYDESDKEEDINRMDNIKELVDVAAKWDDMNFERKGLHDFLMETMLVSDVDGLDESDSVTLLTIHSSKGLEFPIVHIAGAEEGIFPHGRSMADRKEMEEERRLAYVAMTRAEKRLSISYCKFRYEYGNPKPVIAKPSRFLKEIPKEYVKQI